MGKAVAGIPLGKRLNRQRTGCLDCRARYV